MLIRKQVKIINEVFEQTVLKDKCFQGARVFDVCYQTERKEDNVNQLIPYYIDDNHAITDVVIDDSYPLCLYHRILATRKQPLPQNFKQKDIVQQYDMIMVVFAQVNKIKLRSDELEALFAANFPDVIEQSIVSPLDNMVVSHTSSDLNQLAVFRQEYRGSSREIGPEDILIALRYTITSNYTKGCVTYCGCEGSETNICNP